MFALGLYGGCKGEETPLRGGRRELSGEPTVRKRARKGGREGGRGQGQEENRRDYNGRSLGPPFMPALFVIHSMDNTCTETCTV